MDTDNQNNEPETEPETLKATVYALNNLPILTRLEFAANLVFDRGGDRSGLPVDWHAVLLNDILRGVIGVLKTHPEAAGLERPDQTHPQAAFLAKNER
jgi:hypothetical protein